MKTTLPPSVLVLGEPGVGEYLLHVAARGGVRVEVDVDEVLQLLGDALHELVVLLQLTHQQLFGVSLAEGQAVLGEHVEDDSVGPDVADQGVVGLRLEHLGGDVGSTAAVRVRHYLLTGRLLVHRTGEAKVGLGVGGD